MLRFTLHRPSQDSATPGLCGPRTAQSPRAVTLCPAARFLAAFMSHVGVRLVPARNAPESRLAATTAGCDVRAGVAGLRRVPRVEVLDSSGCFLFQPGRECPHPDLRMPRLRPAFCARFLPGFCTVPRAEPVMALTLRLSTRTTSKRPARSVVVLLTQSLRRSPSLAFNRPVRVLDCLRGVDPPLARVSLRWSASNRSASFARKPFGLVISPVDSAAGALTPRSTPATPPAPGAVIGAGTTANAICQQPTRWPVMRYDYRSVRLRRRLNATQPIFATSTLDRARLSCRPAIPRAGRSAGPHPGRLYARSGADGSPRRAAATPGRGRAAPAGGPSATQQQAAAPISGRQPAARPAR